MTAALINFTNFKTSCLCSRCGRLVQQQSGRALHEKRWRHHHLMLKNWFVNKETQCVRKNWKMRGLTSLDPLLQPWAISKWWVRRRQMHVYIVNLLHHSLSVADLHGSFSLWTCQGTLVVSIWRYAWGLVTMPFPSPPSPKGGQPIVSKWQTWNRTASGCWDWNFSNRDIKWSTSPSVYSANSISIWWSFRQSNKTCGEL